MQENESDDENYANEVKQESELAFYRNLVAEDRLKRLVENPNPEPNGRDVLEAYRFCIRGRSSNDSTRADEKEFAFRLFASDQREGKKSNKVFSDIKSKKKRKCSKRERMKDIMMKTRTAHSCTRPKTFSSKTKIPSKF